MLPIIMLPHKHIVHVRLKFHPNVSRTHVQGSIYLHTNASVFTIPVHAYSGRLKVGLVLCTGVEHSLCYGR